ncbi:MAG TPA: imidazole glycerol phosphate synthase subunit HisF [Gemmatimonadaceae bacterium]|nr:imidazole glycerol phosphate synthase subunit HisF [Gemmatimonadaceae bacterium]
MLTRRVIPCLDTRGGRVVKGVQFRNLRDAGSPAECAARYEADGADELVLLDVSATVEGRAHALATVREVRRSIAIPLTVGGGVQSAGDAAALLDAGADKVAINTAAVRQPSILSELAARFGSQCVVLSVDAVSRNDDWFVAVRSGTSLAPRTVVEWIREAAALGAGEILLTSVDRDGTRSGYDVPLIEAVTGSVGVPVVASGGAGSANDLVTAIRAGADAVLAASIFHDNATTISAVKCVLAAAGVEVRP